eukprot:COSAG02_NODE_5740_length_4077_cov_12.821600_1_plen_970_part_00
MPGAGSQNTGGRAERSREEYQAQALACAKKHLENQPKAGWTSKEYIDVHTGKRIVCRTGRKYKNDWANARDKAIKYTELSSMPELARKYGFEDGDEGKAKAKLLQRRWKWDPKEGNIAYGLSEESWRELTCCPCGGKDADKLTVGGKGNPWAPKFKAGIEAAEKIGHQGVVCMKTRKNKPGEFVRCCNYTVPLENPAMAVAAPQPEPEPAHETSAVFYDPDDSQNEIESRALPGGQLYRGNIQDGKFHGKGTLSDKDDTVYEGDWWDGQYHGEGKLRDRDGRKYEGSFEHGKRHGQGTLTETDGRTIYEGDWKDGQYDGKGILTYRNGRRYEGSFEHGKRHGQGTLTETDGSTIYEGEWQEGEIPQVRDGTGTRMYENGEVYKGDFVRGKRHGKGTLTRKGRTIYEGDWRNDEYYTGTGTLTDKEGRTIYEGDWKDGRYHGKGKLTCNAEHDIVYTGEFCDGEPHGTGKYTHKDRVYYAPEGRMEYADGTVYEGRVRMYLDRAPRNYGTIGVLKHGKGKLTYKNGSVYEGSFEFDGKITEGKLTYKDGSVYKGGKLTDKDGNVWRTEELKNDAGEFSDSDDDDEVERQARLRDKNGNVYEGDFGLDGMSGTGTLTDKEGRTIYKGDWQGGKYHGQGALTFTSLSGDRTYEGTFTQGKMSRAGILTYADGAFYEGDVEGSEPHGQGTMLYNDGAVYEGDWQDGKYHGKGKLTDKEGRTIYEGSFEQGKAHGKGKLTDKDGRTIYEGEWRDGKRYSDRAQTVDDVAEQMSTASLSDTGQATGRARSQASSGNPAPRARPRRASLETQSVPGDTANLSDVTEAGDEAKSQRIIDATRAQRDELESQLRNTTADNRQRWDVTELRYDVNHSCERMATENVPENEDQVREQAYLAQREFADALKHIGLTRHADTFAEAGICDIDHLSNMEYDQLVKLGLTDEEILSLTQYDAANTEGDADLAALEEELTDFLDE